LTALRTVPEATHPAKIVDGAANADDLAWHQPGMAQDGVEHVFGVGAAGRAKPVAVCHLTKPAKGVHWLDAFHYLGCQPRVVCMPNAVVKHGFQIIAAVLQGHHQSQRQGHIGMVLAGAEGLAAHGGVDVENATPDAAL